MRDATISSASLIERAAQVYDFGAVLRARPGREEPSPDGGEPADEEVAAGGVPAPAARFGAVDREALAEAGFLLPDAPVCALAEEFRIVKRQLLLAAMAGTESGEPADARARSILVCSARPDEGKTFCAVNLALSMAGEKDIEVLLVDADVAKPEILSTLGLAGGPGLMDALADPAVDAEACVIRTDLGNLSVLPAGRQTNEATELLASDRTRLVLDRLARHPARIVIFDSPPALAASLAPVLALHVGQAMLVVRADRTSETDLRDALGLLGGCGDIKLLLNGVRFAPGGRHFDGYYGLGD